MDYKKFFNGTKITLMGLGLLGRGVGDAQFLARHGAELIITDLKSEEELRESLKQLRMYPNITYRLGEHVPDDFKDRDLIIKAANVPLNSPYLAEAEKHGIRIAQSTELFANFFDGTIVGVTGTKGKSTVTHLIHHILTRACPKNSPCLRGECSCSKTFVSASSCHQHASSSDSVSRQQTLRSRLGNPGFRTCSCFPERQILLGGNIPGMSTLALLDAVHKNDNAVAVLELDSWQLQGFGASHISPHISIFTNFMPDHLNYYKDDLSSGKTGMDRYFEDKAYIFTSQKEADQLFFGPQAALIIQEKYPWHAKRMHVIGKETLPAHVQTPLLGEHNKENTALAYAVVRSFGITDDAINSALKTFPGIPGRLQFLREVDGVEYYNDNNATTPEATIAGLRAVSEDKNVVLIMGGADKGLDAKGLIQVLPDYCKSVVLLPGTGTDTIKSRIHNVEWSEVASMEEAVRKAREIAEEGDVVLLSPGFASFGLFVNEYERSEVYESLVGSL